MWKIKQNYVKQCLTEMGKTPSMKILSRRSKKTDESVLRLANSVTSRGHFPQGSGWSWGVNSLHNVPFCWDQFSVTCHRISKNYYWALWRCFSFTKAGLGNAITWLWNDISQLQMQAVLLTTGVTLGKLIFLSLSFLISKFGKITVFTC